MRKPIDKYRHYATFRLKAWRIKGVEIPNRSYDNFKQAVKRMENKGADGVIGLGKSCQVLQSPGLGCDGVVCMHLNYSVMVRPEITRFRI
jgi:hypothetical protein